MAFHRPLEELLQCCDWAPPFLALTFSLDCSIIFNTGCKKITTTGCYHKHTPIYYLRLGNWVVASNWQVMVSVGRFFFLEKEDHSWPLILTAIRVWLLMIAVMVSQPGSTTKGQPDTQSASRDGEERVSTTQALRWVTTVKSHGILCDR